MREKKYPSFRLTHATFFVITSSNEMFSPIVDSGENINNFSFQFRVARMLFVLMEQPEIIFVLSALLTKPMPMKQRTGLACQKE